MIKKYALLNESQGNIGELRSMNYDVLIIGAGPGGIFSAYELVLRNPELKIGVL